MCSGETQALVQDELGRLVQKLTITMEVMEHLKRAGHQMSRAVRQMVGVALRHRREGRETARRVAATCRGCGGVVLNPGCQERWAAQAEVRTRLDDAILRLVRPAADPEAMSLAEVEAAMGQVEALVVAPWN